MVVDEDDDDDPGDDATLVSLFVLFSFVYVPQVLWFDSLIMKLSAFFDELGCDEKSEHGRTRNFDDDGRLVKARVGLIREQEREADGDDSRLRVIAVDTGIARSPYDIDLNQKNLPIRSNAADELIRRAPIYDLTKRRGPLSTLSRNCPSSWLFRTTETPIPSG
jgi:hypothetical protein